MIEKRVPVIFTVVDVENDTRFLINMFRIIIAMSLSDFTHPNVYIYTCMYIFNFFQNKTRYIKYLFFFL